MSRFMLPETRPENRAAFGDPAGATAWLAAQPQANAPAMQAALLQQIEALNRFTMDPGVRLKTLEALRRAAFTIDRDCQKRFESRSVPLPSLEQSLLDNSRRLWRALTTGYMHCLRACLDGSAPVLGRLHANIAHRALAGLRMEQASCYLANAEPDSSFWQTLHVAFHAAEKLSAERELVTDKLLAETAESSVTGQYAMALLLHLARPFELSRVHFAAVTRWLARWREQAGLLIRPDETGTGRCLEIDLAAPTPLAEPTKSAKLPRWLAIGGVQRKIRKRLELLATGESPEALRLGNTVTAEVCSSLLSTLCDSLSAPVFYAQDADADSQAIPVVAGLETIFKLLGGSDLKASAEATAFSNRLSSEQIAVFGHVRRDHDGRNRVQTEDWQLIQQSGDDVFLVRPESAGESRLAHQSLIALQLPGKSGFSLATLSSLRVGQNGRIHITACCLPGSPSPLTADIREKAGAPSRHPAFLLSSPDSAGQTLVLPLGIPGRAATIRFTAFTEDGERSEPLRLSTCLERYGDSERWAIVAGD